MRHTLSKGQNIVGQHFNIFAIAQNMQKLDTFMHRKIRNYKIFIVFGSKYTNI